MSETQRTFTGDIPKNYHEHLGPLFFKEYASDLANRASSLKPKYVLELAAGTGIATRYLREVLPAETKIIATDLNEEMISYAKSEIGQQPNLEYKTVDAQELPFPANSFDLVACQFGVMFFPDKLATLNGIYRCLKPGGTFLFNVWNSIEENDLTLLLVQILKGIFPDDPPTFMETPFGWHRKDEIKATLLEAGFSKIDITSLPKESVYQTAQSAATGLIKGNPLSLELTERGNISLDQMVEKVAGEFTKAFGEPSTGAKMSAIVISAS